ncbi:uncharacterized protein LOC127439882 [Myxocyprinus asiaticus]|uniref:uncharacterized protein LOC127439882 n=1 Tax=Myxocyprinus asiaticus TaxID=70543 RepID=UPI0022219D23|nr:uncharacterized protein LOC127439882 [Myxocyprinus asiaticus]
MLRAVCQKGGELFPLQILTEHVKTCEIVVEDDDEEKDHNNNEIRDVDEQKESVHQPCPMCLEMFSPESIIIHASSCGESAAHDDLNVSNHGNESRRSSAEVPDEQTISPSTSVSVHLEANTEITTLFEGEAHLVPSSSRFLVESDLFVMAGKMLGHSFIHGGPSLSGLSPAFVHVLVGGNPDTATIQLNDIPDLDIRDTIQLLEGESKFSEEKSRVQKLAYAWDLPGITDINRRWLFEDACDWANIMTN